MGSTLTTSFSVDEGGEDPNTTKSGPSSAHQRKAILMEFGWWADDGPTLNADLMALSFFMGSGPVLLRNPIALRFFRGLLPSGSAHDFSIRTINDNLNTMYGRVHDILVLFVQTSNEGSTAHVQMHKLVRASAAHITQSMDVDEDWDIFRPSRTNMTFMRTGHTLIKGH